MKHTGEVLKEIMFREGLRQIDIVEKCQPFCRKYNVRLGKEDISQYINKKAKPNQDRVAILAMALNVNEAYLMGFDVSPVPTNIDIDEQQLLNSYRQLTPTNKSIVTNLINQLLEAQK